MPGPMTHRARAALVVTANDVSLPALARIGGIICRAGSLAAWAAVRGIGPVAGVLLGANGSALGAAPPGTTQFPLPTMEQGRKGPPARAERHSWTIYQNARFGTRLAYPGDIFGRGRQSDNGDGITMRSADSATLAIFGQWNIDDLTPAAYLARLIREPRYGRIAYRLVRPNLLIVSGTRGPRIYYERYAFEGSGGALHAFVLEYPASAQPRYGPIISRMSASLSWVVPAIR